MILTTGWVVVPFRVGGDHRRKSNGKGEIVLMSRPVEPGCLCGWPTGDIQQAVRYRSCLSSLGLLSQKVIAWVAYIQQKIISHSVGV